MLQDMRATLCSSRSSFTLVTPTTTVPTIIEHFVEIDCWCNDEEFYQSNGPWVSWKTLLLGEYCVTHAPSQHLNCTFVQVVSIKNDPYEALVCTKLPLNNVIRITSILRARNRRFRWSSDETPKHQNVAYFTDILQRTELLYSLVCTCEDGV